VQDFSVHNIDKFSTASLVTRMTTDVNNVQMTFMMLIRTAIRSPLMFTFAITMSFIMGGALAATFIVVVPVLVFGLLKVAKKAMPAFRAVFRKYDKLNESIEENVRGMRVVKGFSREEYEKVKFGKASDDIAMDFTKADRIVALNNPIMQFCVYFNMVFILSVGSMLIVKNQGTLIDVGQISAMLTYAMQVLMSLMMLSMVYVMTTISAESARRIVEVLNEVPSIVNPENPITELADGSIDFVDVNFKYSDKAKKYALSDVDLHIDSGMTVGILGGTGSSRQALSSLSPVSTM
jgi:ATP-binding cassette subfamily B protein